MHMFMLTHIMFSFVIIHIMYSFVLAHSMHPFMSTTACMQHVCIAFVTPSVYTYLLWCAVAAGYGWVIIFIIINNIIIIIIIMIVVIVILAAGRGWLGGD